ncbi:MAG: methyltransferase domain-containing protein [Hyphomicrobiales bacterium]|nr:methyltransferase domain-containing protein [Hyphomicrobiales bacterium]MCP5370701.1 methyltransferase domain-containing protein [Hyphomicrobiales bacterium]
MTDPIRIFDRALLRQRRDRAAPGLAGFDFLFRETAARLADRLDDITRTFPLALDLGCRGGELAAAVAGHGGIETLVACDPSARMLALDRAGGAPGPRVAADAEALPFADHSFDAVLSNFDLHWVNDLPGALVQARRVLKPDGLFLAVMAGGATLHELRRALSEAEEAVDGGVSPRVSPFADVRDVGNLLQRAGFALPVADSETVTVSYGDPLRLMADLRGMGESNAVIARRRRPLRRETLLTAAARYRDLFAGADGRVPATFELVTLTAWAPHPSQQRPLAPGSGAVDLGDALGD